MALLVARSFEPCELGQAHRGHSHAGAAAECSAAVDVALACFVVADAEEFIPQNCAISCGICVGSWNSMQCNCFHRSGSTAHDADRCREQRQKRGSGEKGKLAGSLSRRLAVPSAAFAEFSAHITKYITRHEICPAAECVVASDKCRSTPSRPTDIREKLTPEIRFTLQHDVTVMDRAMGSFGLRLRPCRSLGNRCEKYRRDVLFRGRMYPRSRNCGHNSPSQAGTRAVADLQVALSRGRLEVRIRPNVRHYRGITGAAGWNGTAAGP